MANFKQFAKSSVSNDRLFMVDNGSDISFFISLSIITGMLLGLITLSRLKVFMTSSISSAVVGDKKNDFVFFFVKKEMKFFLALRTVLSSFPAIDVKKLLKWFAMIKSSEVVLLSIFKAIW